METAVDITHELDVCAFGKLVCKQARKKDIQNKCVLKRWCLLIPRDPRILEKRECKLLQEPCSELGL
jgi:hypothetical protein